MELASGTVGLRSPRVKRRRISRRSLGSERRDKVNVRRSDGEPVVDDDAQLSRIDPRVGAWEIQLSM